MYASCFEWAWFVASGLQGLEGVWPLLSFGLRASCSPRPLSRAGWEPAACSAMMYLHRRHLHFLRWPRCREGFSVKEKRGRYWNPFWFILEHWAQLWWGWSLFDHMSKSKIEEEIHLGMTSLEKKKERSRFRCGSCRCRPCQRDCLALGSHPAGAVPRAGGRFLQEKALPSSSSCVYRWWPFIFLSVLVASP